MPSERDPPGGEPSAEISASEAPTDPGPEPPSRPIPPDPGERYQEPTLLGKGGMSTVWSVTDRLFDRVVALKTPHLRASPLALRRFHDEARITARLDHPGVVPVHDQGLAADGRPYLVMQRVEGHTLQRLIERRASTGEPTVRRLVDVLRSVTETVAFAHERGVVHRDIKPENIMVGQFGEVRVMDWGIARVVGAELDPRDDALSENPQPAALEASLGGPRTGTGIVTGTLHYVSPEQARGDPIGPPSDVYTLGLLLVELVTGRRARRNSEQVGLLLEALRHVDVPDSLPDVLAELARRALSREPDDRPSATAFARDLAAWLAGEDRADLARARLAEAERAFALVDGLRAEEDALQGRVRSFGPEPSGFRERWELEDGLHELALTRTMHEAEGDRLLALALSHAPELDEVHAAVAAVARARCERAEAEGERLEAVRQEALVARHDRGAHRAWLTGEGAVTLHTDPRGVPVVAHRLVVRDRRLVPGETRALGVTPLDATPLPRGSWLLDVGGHTVPVYLRRGEHWDGVPPGERETRPLRLLAPGPGEAWVPEGWALLGGDREARHPRRRARVWVDGFVMRVHPVTHGEYLAFLRDLEASGRMEEAELHVPRTSGLGDDRPPPVYVRDDAGWHLPEADWTHLPAFLVAQLSACAFAAWEAARTGLPWRLPTRAEREKAGRGADGRLFPWGDSWHPEWSNLGDTFAEPRPVPIDEFPLDVSPYGIRGLGGNVSDWLHDGLAVARMDLDGGRALRVQQDDPYSTFAGGAWNSGVVYARCANFGRYGSDAHVTSLGFRLARAG